MSDKKVNPKKKPATQYGVERARREGRYEGFNGLMSMFLWVMFEDFGFSDEDLTKTKERILYYCDELQSGRLRLEDILSALDEEHDLPIQLTKPRRM